MQDANILRQRFATDADEIARSLIKALDLTHSGKIEHLAEPLTRWLDFRLRIIDPRPRRVHLSDCFPKTLDIQTGQALRSMVEAIKRGDDINHFQSKSLIYSDPSGTRRGGRTDLLWGDWGIHHLHIAEQPSNHVPGFATRSDHLLFLLAFRDDVLFIDVRTHAEGSTLFSDQELVQVVARNWLEVMQPFELKNVLAGGFAPTSEERMQLRRSGIATPLEIDGKVYIGPGLGITSASTPAKVTLAKDRVIRNIVRLAELVAEPSGQFQQAIPESIRDRAQFSLALMPLGIGLFEEETKHGWIFPEMKFDGTDSLLAELSDSFTPPWIKKAMMEAQQRGV
ncbi:hypothetical protein [Paraburkholderia acidipaludis]|uniref:hypothetical protein n=1 Tax=Paraburkholderia acidipaludis TaxID=660537 RepID=UPI0012EB8861|nr:hypothetical protein [Paraburkholderia acidipaludis]